MCKHMKKLITIITTLLCGITWAQDSATERLPFRHILNSTGCPVLLIEETVFHGDAFFRHDGEGCARLVVGKVRGSIGVDIKPGTVVLMERQGDPDCQTPKCAPRGLYIAQCNRDLYTRLHESGNVIFVDGYDFTSCGAAGLLRYPQHILNPGWAELQNTVRQILHPPVPTVEEIKLQIPAPESKEQLLFAAAGSRQGNRKSKYYHPHRLAPEVGRLIDDGANINARCNEEGMTPLMNAARNNDGAACALLMGAGAEPNMRDIYGRTAIHYAIHGMSVPTHATSTALSTLLAFGIRADIESLGFNEREPVYPQAATALHYAIMLNNEDAVYLLLRAGADAQAKDSQGRTPLDLAKERNASPDLIKRLQEAATESAQPAAAR